MARHFLNVAVMALALVACGAPATDTPAPASETVTAPTPPPATGFITSNDTPPTGADYRDDGTVRDDYGRPYQYAGLGQDLPSFTAEMLDGSTFSSDAIDQWTVIDVWGIWCSDCMADAPYVQALSTAIAQDPDLDFLSIHTPPSAVRAGEAYGKYGSVDAYFAAKGYSYPTIVDGDASLRDTLNIAWTPSYLLVDPQGVVRGFRTDLSAAGDNSVKTFLQDIASVRRENQ